jgi:hypothetical protein
MHAGSEFPTEESIGIQNSPFLGKCLFAGLLIASASDHVPAHAGEWPRDREHQEQAQYNSTSLRSAGYEPGDQQHCDP